MASAPEGACYRRDLGSLTMIGVIADPKNTRMCPRILRVVQNPGRFIAGRGTRTRWSVQEMEVRQGSKKRRPLLRPGHTVEVKTNVRASLQRKMHPLVPNRPNPSYGESLLSRKRDGFLTEEDSSVRGIGGPANDECLYGLDTIWSMK